MTEKGAKKMDWTPEQRAQHRAIREAFRDWHPGPEELIESGEAARLGLNVLHSPARELLRELKQVREAAGLTLAEVARRCGIDQPALSRLESGHNSNPTVETLWKYAAALGRQLVLGAEPLKKAERVRRNGAPGKPVRKRRKAGGEKPA
jgi:DNA-binding XRE family transcriptional regulator